ncbi:hypothetical protein WG909_04845 [Peptostreptococcaceae bacterium AGR-M142]
MIYRIEDNSFAISKPIKEYEKNIDKELNTELYLGDYKRFNELYIREIEKLREIILQKKVIRTSSTLNNHLFEKIYEPIVVDFKIRNLKENLDSYYFYAKFLKDIEYNLNILYENKEFSQSNIEYLNLVDEFLKDSINKNKEIYLKNHDLHVENNDGEEKIINKNAYKKRDLIAYDEYKDYLESQMKDKKYKKLQKLNKDYEAKRITIEDYKNYIDSWTKNYKTSKVINDNQKIRKINELKNTLKILNIEEIDLDDYKNELVDGDIEYSNEKIKIRYKIESDELNIDIKDYHYEDLIKNLADLKYEILIENKNQKTNKEKIFNIECIKNYNHYYDKDNLIYLKVNDSDNDYNGDIKISIKEMKLFLEDKNYFEVDIEEILLNKKYINEISDETALLDILVFKQSNDFRYRAIYKIEDKSFAVEFLFKDNNIKEQYLEKYIQIKKISI